VSYFQGQAVDLSCTFADPSGAPYAPTTVACLVTDPAGGVQGVALNISGNMANGVYMTTIPGLYVAKWTASGGPDNRQGKAAQSFYCQPDL
jgi:hypothetical protein